MTRRDELRRFTLRVASAMLAFGWTAAWGLFEVLPPPLIDLPWVQLSIGVAISYWGGATATIQRYLASVYDEKPFHWRMELLKDTFVSGTVGGTVYLAGWVRAMSNAELGLTLLLAGYCGVRLLGFATEHFFKALDR